MYKAFNNLCYIALIQSHSASLWTWPLSLNVVFGTAVLSGASLALGFLWGSILLSSLQSSTTASFYSKSKVFPPFPWVSKHIQELWFSQAFILEHSMCNIVKSHTSQSMLTKPNCDPYLWLYQYPHSWALKYDHPYIPESLLKFRSSMLLHE